MHHKLLNCPMELTANVVGNRWKPLIVHYLLDGTKRFGELRRCIPKISQKVLTDNLRSMEEDGLIRREVFAEVPVRVEYTLTEIGKSLEATIHAMQSWGIAYQNLHPAPAESARPE